jgi:hypothetical protein
VDDPQAARLAKNEAMFRRVNEAIEALSRESDETIEWSPISFVCECGALECARVIDVQRAAYEAVRAQPKQFIVVPGHERVDVEAVIERRTWASDGTNPGEIDIWSRWNGSSRNVIVHYSYGQS